MAASAAVVAALAAGTAGCGSSGDDGVKPSPSATAAAVTAGTAGGTTAPGAPDPTPTPTAAVMTVEDTYAALQHAMNPGCTTVEECQALMDTRLVAVGDLRAAMQAADPARYAEPIADADRADRIAQQYGLDNLGALGNMAAVMQPIQAAVTWYATNR